MGPSTTSKCLYRKLFPPGYYPPCPRRFFVSHRASISNRKLSSDRNHLWTPSDQTSRPFFFQNSRPAMFSVLRCYLHLPQVCCLFNLCVNQVLYSLHTFVCGCLWVWGYALRIVSYSLSITDKISHFIKHFIIILLFQDLLRTQKVRCKSDARSFCIPTITMVYECTVQVCFAVFCYTAAK